VEKAIDKAGDKIEDTLMKKIGSEHISEEIMETTE